MTARIKAGRALAAVSVMGLICAAPGGAFAKPDKPENAAQTSSGSGCLVRDAVGAYHYDADCQWHLVVKRDKDGNLVSFSYQDKGKLPEDAPHPDKAMKNSGPWPACGADINEVTTPSGQYSSDCRYKN
ncbi:MAG: hypothetical protein VX640_13095 [Pseudomonadota bacterium]|nr:hypothetical protein [Pseudomonadota bacterium]